MATPSLYCIHGADALEDLGTLQQVSKKFKEQQRIADFIPIPADAAMTMLSGRFTKNDLIILLLSYDLEKKRKELTTLLTKTKEKHPESTIVEIIIDNIPFVNDYITLPRDLKPIRDAQNVPGAWHNIEEDLDKVIPKPRPDWTKYLKYGIPAAIALVALFLWRPWEPEKEKEQSDPKTSEDIEAVFTANVTECEVPCEVKFKNSSSEGSSYQWDFGDGGVSSEASPTHVFEKAGTFDVKLVASKDGKQSEKTQAIDVRPKPPIAAKPKAAFTSDKTSCTAPCTIVFTNSSQNADSYRWDFGSGPPNEEASPTHTFNSVGTFRVKLTAKGNGQQDVAEGEIVITSQPPPIASFNPSTTRCLVPCKVNFTNQSQNATSYHWSFGDGGFSTDPNPSHQYQTLGRYQVKLIATNNAGQIDDTKTITVGASVNAGPFQISTTASDATIVTGDDEIDSDDWTSVELSYSMRIVNSNREIELVLNWYSQERNGDRSKGNTRYKSSKTFPLFKAPSGSVIDDVQGIVRSENNEKYYPGEVHGLKDFPTTGSLRQIKVRVDASGAHDKQQQKLTATLASFSVLLKPNN